MYVQKLDICTNFSILNIALFTKVFLKRGYIIGLQRKSPEKLPNVVRTCGHNIYISCIRLKGSCVRTSFLNVTICPTLLLYIIIKTAINIIFLYVQCVLTSKPVVSQKMASTSDVWLLPRSAVAEQSAETVRTLTAVGPI